MDTETIPDSDDVRGRILAAAATLIADGGRDAVTTRAVSAAASVQAPTIYRLFGDKRGLLEAVAEHGMKAYVAGKAVRTPHEDPVEDLRHGWDTHVAFGLAHPGLFAIMSGDAGPPSPATQAGIAILRAKVHRIAQAGRLKISESRAVDLMHGTGTGVVLTLLSQPDHQRDLGLSDTAREAVISAMVSDAPIAEPPGPASAAITLRALLPEATALSSSEKTLLGEWLDRIARDKPS